MTNSALSEAPSTLIRFQTKLFCSGYGYHPHYNAENGAIRKRFPEWSDLKTIVRTDATIRLQFRGPIYWNAHASSSFDHAHWGYNSVFKQIRRCSVDRQKRYENDKCGRKSFWKRSRTAPFSFENGLVWTGSEERELRRLFFLKAVLFQIYRSVPDSVSR